MDIQADSRIIKKDLELSGKVSIASPLYLLLIIVIAITTSYYDDYPEIILLAAGLQFLILLYRKTLSLFLPDKYSQNPMMWRYMIFLGIYLAAVLWCGFSILTLHLYGFGLPGIIVLLLSTGIASGSTTGVALSYTTGRNFILLIIAPVAIWCAFFRGKEGTAICIMAVIYTVVLIRNIKGYNSWYHENLSNMELLNNRTSELINMNKNLENEIHYRKNTEKALRRSEERYKILFQNNPIETIIVDHTGKITGYNTAKAKTKGRVPDIDDIMYKDYGAKHENNMFSELMDCIKSGKQKEFPEQKYRDKFLHIKISPFSGGAIITSIDITKRKHAEQQIQTLTREIMRIQENERKRIARDLHDSVAQDLSSLRISCETFFDDTHTNPFKIKKKINEISRVLHGAILAVRDIAYELRPPSLDEFGLAITLYRYCEEFSSKNDIDVDFFSAGLENVTIESDTEINLYRLVQEALSNIKKHSRARNVVIRLVASYPNVILRIEDNGIGFESGLQTAIGSKNKRMGLRSMEERASLLGGRIKLQSRPGEGTCVFVEAPVLFKEKQNKKEYSSIVANQ